MSFDSDGPTDLAGLPPPAYEVSQQEFDQKTSSAIEQSLSEPPQTNIVDEDGWPVYDAAVFEAVASSYERSAAGSSSTLEGSAQNAPCGASAGDVKRSLPTSGVASGVQPLRVRRRDKADPKVLQVTTGSVENSRNPPIDNDMPPDGEDGRASPPPPFTPVGPSLDGPPFEDVVRLTYNGPDSRASSPLSSPPPPNSRELPAMHRRPERSNSPQRPLRYQRQSPPAFHRPMDRRTSPRPSTGYTVPPRSNQATMMSRLDFDASVAYTKRPFEVTNVQSTPLNHDPSAFYSHAIASQLTSAPAAPTLQPDRGYPLSSQYRTPRASSPMPPMPPMPPQAPTRDNDCPQQTNVQRAGSPNVARMGTPPFSVPGSTPGFHRPAYTPSAQPQLSTDSRTSGSGVGVQPQWAVSEAQLVRDLYRARG